MKTKNNKMRDENDQQQQHSSGKTFFFFPFRYSATFCSLPGRRTTTTTEKRRKLFECFLSIPLFISIYIFSQTQREKRDKQESERLRVHLNGQIAHSDGALGFSYFYFFRSFRLLAKKNSPKSNQTENMCVTRLYVNTPFIYIVVQYIYTAKKGEH